jgi:hypothetical protein
MLPRGERLWTKVIPGTEISGSSKLTIGVARSALKPMGMPSDPEFDWGGAQARHTPG